MSDTTQLEKQILADVTAAADETALEAVRVAALGKQGSITALLKTLGTMTPEQRKAEGPLINGLKDRVHAALDPGVARDDSIDHVQRRAAANDRRRATEPNAHATARRSGIFLKLDAGHLALEG